MRKRSIVGAILASGALVVTLVPGAAASEASCTGQFASTGAQVVRPFGQVIVVPEVRALALGGPNLGQEVKVLFATADRDACPVPPPAP